MNQLPSSLIILAIVFFPLQGAFSQELHEIIISGNESAVGSIESYYAEVDWSESQEDQNFAAEDSASPPTNDIRKCIYWRTPNGVRLREVRGVQTLDAEIIGGESRLIITDTRIGESQQEVGMTIDVADLRIVDTDPWELSMFSLPVGIYSKDQYPVYTLSEAVDVGNIRNSSWEELNGQRLAKLRVDIEEKRRSYEIWANPNYNWMIVKANHTVNDEDGNILFRNEYRATDYIEIEDAIFVPQRVDVIMKFKDLPPIVRVARIKNITVNQPLPPIPPMPKIKRGSMVVNEIEGTAYVTNEDGRQIGVTKRIGEPVVAYGSNDDQARSDRVTAPRVGYIVLAIGITAGSIWALRRLKKRDRNPDS